MGRLARVARRTIAAVLVSAMSFPVAAMERAASADAMPIFVELHKPAAGPRGAVAIIGDSVMLGSSYEASGWGPSVAQMMVERGWGPVRLKAGVGFQTGRLNASNPGADMGRWLLAQRATGFDPAVIMVSLGPNEILSCNGSAACAAASIRYFLDIAGPDRQVWWTLITMTKASDQDAWNAGLLTVAVERPNLLLWDWPAMQQTYGIPLAADHIHLPTAAAYRARSRLMADDVTSRIGPARRVGGPATPPAPGDALTYRPVGPSREVDTRATDERLPAGGVLTVDLDALAPESVGSDVRAVAVNVAAADPATAGFLTVHPCGGAVPLAASVNFPAGQPRSAQAMSLLGPGATLCVFSSTAADVVIDLQGVFVADGGDRLSPSTPARLLDTRLTGRAPTLAVAAPDGSTAVALTITTTAAALPGFLAAYPCGGEVPTVANVNWGAGETISGAAFVPVGDGGKVCVFTNAPADVIVDLTGTFSPSGALRFVPVPPTRMLDTRDTTGGWQGPLGVAQTVDVVVAPADAAAVTGTLVIVSPAVDAYLTGTVCGTPPGETASVSAAGSAVMANSLTVGLSGSGVLCLYSLVSTHAVFDSTGWWVP